MFESPWTRRGVTWDEYVREWTKPDFPEVTQPPEEAQTAEVAKLRKKG
jgi:hypothetical protein